VDNSSAQTLPRIIGLMIRLAQRPYLAGGPQFKRISPIAQTG
jgi:hypothetical protein